MKVIFLSWWTFIVLCLAVGAATAQNKTTISFSIPSKGTGLSQMIFHQDIEGVYLQTEDSVLVWQLFQKVGNDWKKQDAQVQRGHPNILYGRYDDIGQKGEAINFEWRQIKSDVSPGIMIKDNGKSFNFKYKDSLLLSYRYKPMPVPQKVDQVYSRSGFVHPLKTLKGNVLTQIQPPDHYHHYGLWHPWTHTEYEGEEIDFWNLKKKQGTVRHSDVISVSEGPLFSELTVLHDHIIHPGRGEQTVLKELLTYRVWKPSEGQDSYTIDVIYHMNPSTDKPLTIKQYRYEGFSIRGPAHWHDDNVNLLTSQGKNKSNGNATRARWMKVTGPGDQDGISSFAMMTHPANYNFPELIRIWPTGANGGKESVFLNFNPTQDRDWILKPGHTYTLQYRLIISDNNLGPEEMNHLWSNYSGREIQESK